MFRKNQELLEITAILTSKLARDRIRISKEYIGDNMSETIRFGVSLESNLLKRFDGLIEQQGYPSRSEAIRDLIRECLVSQEWQGGEEETIGVLSLVYDHEFRELGENIYIAGLLHNIGIIIEDQFLQNNFIDALVQSKNDKCNLLYAEKNIIGFDHTDIGRAIADDWDFPDKLVIAIGNHHEPESVDEKIKKFVLTTYISDYICQRNDIGYCDAPYENQSLYAKCLRELKIQEKAMDFIVEDVQKEIEKMKKDGWFQNE